MSETSISKPMTHDAWQKNYRAGKFVGWRQVGDGRVEVDSRGKAKSYTYYDRTVRGDTGYTVLLPKGETPPMPKPQPKRPDDSGEDEET